MFVRNNWVPRDVLTTIIDRLPLPDQTRCKRVCQDFRRAVRRIPLPPPISKDFHSSYVLRWYWTEHARDAYVQRLQWLVDLFYDEEFSQREFYVRNSHGGFYKETHDDLISMKYMIHDGCASATVSEWRRWLRRSPPGQHGPINSGPPHNAPPEYAHTIIYPMRTERGELLLLLPDY